MGASAKYRITGAPQGSLAGGETIDPFQPVIHLPETIVLSQSDKRIIGTLSGRTALYA